MYQNKQKKREDAGDITTYGGVRISPPAHHFRDPKIDLNECNLSGELLKLESKNLELFDFATRFKTVDLL